jgi:diadenosine tetraphosphate (Ap4A) HIT family hydrolase
MPKSLKYLALLIFPAVLLLRADVRACQCNLDDPKEMAQRECSLCAVAEHEPAYLTVFFLKDANPTKPDRELALPRLHEPGSHLLSDLPAATRAELWSAAIAHAQELWGDNWGIACNSPEKRTQCHTHLHIGKLLPDQENTTFTIVTRIEDIPAPGDNGILVHPVDGKLHCHLEAAPELSLMR